MLLDTNIEEVSGRVASVFAAHPVRRAWLFGSFARGEQTPGSDIDFQCEIEPDARFGMFAMGQLIVDLQRVLGREVDIVTAPIDRIDSPAFRENLLEERVLVYDGKKER